VIVLISGADEMGTISGSFKPGYQHDGLSSFLGRLKSLVKENENLVYYLYECRPAKWNEADFLPKIRDFTLEIITAEDQLDELIAGGFNLSLDSPWTREGVKKGAVAFLLFVGKELASRELVATNEEAKKAIDGYPYKVDFAHKEACAAGVWTNPGFRHQGLHTYVFYRAYDYLLEHGIEIVRSIVAADNFASQRAHERFNPGMRKYARGRYFKILGIPFRKEVALK
jgi:RimJ/RimL family protein N-acetyltransferase